MGLGFEFVSMRSIIPLFVSIARAMAKNPKLLLCDEPTGALDYATGKKILKLLHDVSREKKRLVIIVTHNSALKEMADKVIYIKSGMIERIETNSNPKPSEVTFFPSRIISPSVASSIPPRRFKSVVLFRSAHSICAYLQLTETNARNYIISLPLLLPAST